MVLNDIYSRQLLELDYQLVSVHIWEVPYWYRRLFPLRFREALRKLIQERWAFRPHLQLLGYYSASPPNGRRLKWTKEEGVFSEAMSREAQLSTSTHSIDYRLPVYRKLAEGQEEQTWNDSKRSTRQAMSYQHFLNVYSKYRQVAAVGISVDGDIAGCVTIEVQPGFRDELIKNEPLKERMLEVARELTYLIR